MARCDGYEAQLWEAAETGQMPDTLARHLADCPRCREALNELQEAVRGFAALRAEETPPLVLHLPARAHSGRWRPWFGYSFAVVIVLAIGIMLLLSGSLRRHAPTPMVIKREHLQPDKTVVQLPKTPPTRQAAPARKIAPPHRRVHEDRHPARLQRTVVKNVVPVPEQREPAPLPADVVVVYGAVTTDMLAILAAPESVPPRDYIPLSAMPISYAITNLGTEMPPIEDEIIPIYGDTPANTSEYIHEENHHAFTPYQSRVVRAAADSLHPTSPSAVCDHLQFREYTRRAEPTG